MLQIACRHSIALIAAASIALVCGPSAFGQRRAPRAGTSQRPTPRAGTRTLPPLPKGQALVLQVACARSLPKKMTKQERASVAKVVKSLRAGNTKTARQEWEILVTSMVQGNASPVDINALVQSVLRESYLETNKDLQFYADKARFYNEMRTEIRNHLRKMRIASSQYKTAPVSEPASRPVSVYVVTDVPTFDMGNSSERPVLTMEMLTVQAGKSVLDAEMKKLEEKLSTVGDDAQLANIDLQNKLQQQQQTIQLMTNVSKILHDTATAVIRKIG